MHLLQEKYNGMGDGTIRALYDAERLIPTSTDARVALVRSHIAYWSGCAEAEAATITRSRGHTIRVKTRNGLNVIVTLPDEFDHRAGVNGWISR